MNSTTFRDDGRSTRRLKSDPAVWWDTYVRSLRRYTDIRSFTKLLIADCQEVRNRAEVTVQLRDQ